MSTKYSRKRAVFEKRATNLTERLHWLLDEMPDKGLTSETSQKMCLLNTLREFEHCINGTVPADFIEEGDE